MESGMHARMLALTRWTHTHTHTHSVQGSVLWILDLLDASHCSQKRESPISTIIRSGSVLSRIKISHKWLRCFKIALESNDLVVTYCLKLLSNQSNIFVCMKYDLFMNQSLGLKTDNAINQEMKCVDTQQPLLGYCIWSQSPITISSCRWMDNERIVN